jgi:uncharacterized protein with FMN-binding domain
MRRAVLAVVVTAIGLVLLMSFKPHDITAATQPPAAVSGSGSDSGSSGSGSSGSGNSGSGNSGSGSSRKGATSSATTATGDTVDTRWGPVQVKITVAAGKIKKVEVLQSPNGNQRDIEINNTALPILTEEALSAQSAAIDVVSGATYTSDGYTRSLQSAIDKAGL